MTATTYMPLCPARRGRGGKSNDLMQTDWHVVTVFNTVHARMHANTWAHEHTHTLCFSLMRMKSEFRRSGHACSCPLSLLLLLLSKSAIVHPKRIRKQQIKSKLHRFSNFFKMLPTVVQYTIASAQCELEL